ncbi:MAG: Phosphate-import ATP-binding protein PhnC [Pseudomonadota bacterium]|jgi:phosphonate transport system ATP-binding protein
MLHIQNLNKSYTASKPILQGINLHIEGSGLTAIIGASGTGKSTLLRCINRLIDSTSGQILFEGIDLAALSGKDLRQARRRIGMVFQEYNLVERLSVMENLLTGRLGYMGSFAAWMRKFDAADIVYGQELLQIVGLASFANQRADSLSGGQRQRVGIARALMQRPALLLADEPTSSLDPKTSVEIMQLLQSQGRERGIPVIVNMHDVALAKRFADRIVGMRGGKVVFDGVAVNLTDGILNDIYGGTSWLAT